MFKITTLTEAESVLEAFWPSKLPRHAYTTEHVVAFLQSLGTPQDALPAIHIAGTSGKTSTAYYAAALLRSAGLRVGMLISPHTECITERVQINGKPMSEAEFCSELTIFLHLVEKSGITLTYAEILYAFGYWEFVRQRVDCMVIETGLGGLLDATNVISRSDKLCVLTDIGLDHVHILGTNLSDIAFQKAGIILPHNAVFCYRQADEAMQEIIKTSKQKQADLHIIDSQKEPDLVSLPLFQQRNFHLAYEAVTWWLQRDGRRGPLSAAARTQAIKTSIPVRMEVIQYKGKTLVLDGAHNAQKLAALEGSLKAKFPDMPIAAMVAFIATSSRDAKELVQVVESYSEHIVAISPNVGGHVWRSTEEIMEASSDQTSVQMAIDPAEGLRALLARPEPVLVITGSLYMHQCIRPFLG